MLFEADDIHYARSTVSVTQEFTKRTSAGTTTKTAHSVDKMFKFNHNTVIKLPH